MSLLTINFMRKANNNSNKNNTNTSQSNEKKHNIINVYA